MAFSSVVQLSDKSETSNSEIFLELKQLWIKNMAGHIKQIFYYLLQQLLNSDRMWPSNSLKNDKPF